MAIRWIGYLPSRARHLFVSRQEFLSMHPLRVLGTGHGQLNYVTPLSGY